MTRKVSNEEVIAIAGRQVIEKWTSAKIGRMYRLTTKQAYGIPIVAQYTGVILHDYYPTCMDSIFHAANVVYDTAEDILLMRCEAIEDDNPGAPKYSVIGYVNDVHAIELHFDVMRAGGLVYNIDVLAADGYETEAQQLAGVAMKILDPSVKKLLVKPFF